VCTPPGKGPFPAALLVHGGGWIRGDRTQAARALVRPLTGAGIAWVAVSYRLAPRHTYPAPVEDVPCEQSVRMQKTLRDAGVTCDLITVPDGTHGTREWQERLPGFADQVVAWLAERIKR